ncbi:MAG: hypothetical protein PHV51_05250 [Methanosarcinaceae archaeon]|nr:hypothetical protein [Methanosarcinaceae archaeon]MDD4497542.1 hypothetical protein [Methanosarcinaceae archaeon]
MIWKRKALKNDPRGKEANIFQFKKQITLIFPFAGGQSSDEEFIDIENTDW